MHTIKPKDSLEDITTQLENINKVIQALYYKPGPRGLEYISSMHTSVSESIRVWVQTVTERDKPSQRRGKIKATIERRGPPALDPPILLLVVRRLLVVVLAGRVVVVVATVVVSWGGSLRGSVVCRQR